MGRNRWWRTWVLVFHFKDVGSWWYVRTEVKKNSIEESNPIVRMDHPKGIIIWHPWGGCTCGAGSFWMNHFSHVQLKKDGDRTTSCNGGPYHTHMEFSRKKSYMTQYNVTWPYFTTSPGFICIAHNWLYLRRPYDTAPIICRVVPAYSPLHEAYPAFDLTWLGRNSAK